MKCFQRFLKWRVGLLVSALASRSGDNEFDSQRWRRLRADTLHPWARCRLAGVPVNQAVQPCWINKLIPTSTAGKRSLRLWRCAIYTLVWGSERSFVCECHPRSRITDLGLLLLSTAYDRPTLAGKWRFICQQPLIFSLHTNAHQRLGA